MRTLFVAVMLSVAAAACTRSPIGMPLPETTRFECEWKNYSRLQPNKAIAIAGDRQGVYVAGYAYAQASEVEAVEAALAACEGRRADRRIDAPCRTFAIGQHEVETAATADATFVR